MTRSNTAHAEKRMIFRRALVYGGAIFLLGVLQCAFFARLKPFGVTPDLVLCAVCAILLLDNKHSALICAVAGGYYIDALGAVPPSFSAIIYLLIVALTAPIAQKLIKRAASFILLMLPTVAIKAVFTYANLSLTYASPAPLSSLISVILPELVCTLVFCLPVYFLIKLCSIPIGSRTKFSF